MQPVKGKAVPMKWTRTGSGSGIHGRGYGHGYTEGSGLGVGSGYGMGYMTGYGHGSTRNVLNELKALDLLLYWGRDDSLEGRV